MEKSEYQSNAPRFNWNFSNEKFQYTQVIHKVTSQIV